MDGLGLGAGIMGALGGTEVSKLISDNILSNNFKIATLSSSGISVSASVSSFTLLYLYFICNYIFNNGNGGMTSDQTIFSGIVRQDSTIRVSYYASWDSGLLKHIDYGTPISVASTVFIVGIQ